VLPVRETRIAPRAIRVERTRRASPTDLQSAAPTSRAAKPLLVGAVDSIRCGVDVSVGLSHLHAAARSTSTSCTRDCTHQSEVANPGSLMCSYTRDPHMAAKRPPLPPSDVPMRKRCYRSGLSVKLGDLQLHRVSSRPELTFGPSKDVTETLLKYRPDCIYRHILRASNTWYSRRQHDLDTYPPVAASGII
jgi:hypothetical protein